MSRSLKLVFFCSLLFVTLIAAPVTAQVSDEAGETITTKSGLQYVDMKVGEGPEAQKGDRVKVHYTGWLTDGSKFDSSVDRGEPFDFLLGRGEVIKGWDQGVAGMKIGGKRKLTIPPKLGYGNRGAPNLIPPGATLGTRYSESTACCLARWCQPTLPDSGVALLASTVCRRSCRPTARCRLPGTTLSAGNRRLPYCLASSSFRRCRSAQGWGT